MSQGWPSLAFFEIRGEMMSLDLKEYISRYFQAKLQIKSDLHNSPKDRRKTIQKYTIKAQLAKCCMAVS